MISISMHSGCARFSAATTLAVLLFSLCAHAAPEPVSPGAWGEIAAVESRCPTFSWSDSPGATSYEIVIHEVSAVGTVPKGALPRLRKRLPAFTNTWVPSVDECLHRGAFYEWVVRAEVDGQWQASSPTVFEVHSAPTAEEFRQAVEVMQAYMANPTLQSGAPSHESAVIPKGASNFSVDGGGNVVTASIAADGAGLANVSAVTAAFLANEPANCGAGFAPTGIFANGNAEGCFDVVTEADLDNALDCPAGMSAFGDWCIDDLINLDLQRGVDAIANCAGEGKMLCPFEAIQACDVVNFMNDGTSNTCGTLTDPPGRAIVTSTFCGNVGAGQSTNDMVIYNGADNSAVCEAGVTSQYFCCVGR